MWTRSLALAGLCAALSAVLPQDPPGGGILPSEDALALLQTLSSREFEDTANAFGGGTWTVGKLVVIPNPLTSRSKGPLVSISQGAREEWLPVERDGDIAYLDFLVRGEWHGELDRARSRANRAVWAGRRWVRPAKRFGLPIALENGFVPNAATAISIAQAIWHPIYGKFGHEPKAGRDGDVWRVDGTLPDGVRGGVPTAWIDRHTGRVLGVQHTQ